MWWYCKNPHMSFSTKILDIRKYFVLVINPPLEVQDQLLLSDELHLEAGDPHALVLVILLHVWVVSVDQGLGQRLAPSRHFVTLKTFNTFEAWPRHGGRVWWSPCLWRWGRGWGCLRPSCRGSSLWPTCPRPWHGMRLRMRNINTHIEDKKLNFLSLWWVSPLGWEWWISGFCDQADVLWGLLLQLDHLGEALAPYEAAVLYVQLVVGQVVADLGVLCLQLTQEISQLKFLNWKKGII